MSYSFEQPVVQRQDGEGRQKLYFLQQQQQHWTKGIELNSDNVLVVFIEYPINGFERSFEI